MDSILREFSGYPSQEKVVEEFLRSGIRVEGAVAYCNSIKLSDSAIAAACNVDRRVVRTTLEKIDSNPRLRDAFMKMTAIALLADTAEEMGCTAFDIEPDNCKAPGILADITKVISDNGFSVRQAVVASRGNDDDQHLIIVFNGSVPSELIYLIKNCRGVKTVTLL